MAEATGYFSKNWLKDAIFSQSCPPSCPLQNDKSETGEEKKDDRESDTNDNTDDSESDESDEEEDLKVHELDMESALIKMGDDKNLALWTARPSWGKGKNKRYVEEDCPSFKEMPCKELFHNLDNIVKKFKQSKYFKQPY